MRDCPTKTQFYTRFTALRRAEQCSCAEWLAAKDVEAAFSLSLESSRDMSVQNVKVV